MTHYLKFDDEAQAKAEMGSAGFYHEAQDERPAGFYATESGVALDVVGIIYEPGQYETQDGQLAEVSPPVAHDGYHINMLGTLPESLAAFKVMPTTPRRVFFGVQ